ncbi:MAG TPA: hypothetical protein VG964_02590 [Candidatus Saccharimonadales bacterium]|nr:hypothetical protein [Candidatus Saccharimonadales bacterium]
MARRKKNSWAKTTDWLRQHRRVSWALAALILLLLLLPLHAYHSWADTRKLHQARAAIDSVYSDISLRLGQPGNLKSTNSCTRASSNLHSYNECTVETDFIYASSNQNQADVLLGKVQDVIARHKQFKPTKKLSTKLSNHLVFVSDYHDAIDYYSGPHHIACSVKYSFDTPDEIDLSLNNDPAQKIFEVFFACSARTSKAVF